MDHEQIADDPPHAPVHVNSLVKKLASDAATILLKHPDWELAGLVIEQGAPEFKRWRLLVEQSGGQELADHWIAGLARRDVVLGTLAAGGGPSAIAWIKKATSQPGRWLPIVVVSRDGFRMTNVEMPQGP